MYTRKFEITNAYLRRRPSTFWKTVEKSGEIWYWKKRRLTEYASKVVKNLFINALFTSLIEKWLTNHKKYKFTDFGLKIRIFEISKIKLFEKNILTENCSSGHNVSAVKLL